jgi:hypothetical protein
MDYKYFEKTIARKFCSNFEKAPEILALLWKWDGEDATSKSRVYGCKRISERRNKFEFDSRHERPTTSKSDGNFGKRRTLVQNGGRMAVRITAESLYD